MTNTPPEGITPEFARFYEDAIEAGFEEYPFGGPWGVQDLDRGIDPRTGQFYTVGRRPHDRSVVLRKGDIIIWLVDRDSKRSSHPGNVVHRETWTAGWFKNGHEAFPKPVPEVFSEEEIEAFRLVCINCKKTVSDKSELKRAGFAGWYCPDCHPEMKAKLETPGWAD